MKHLIIATSLALGLAGAAIAQPPSAEERSARAEQHAQKRLDRMSEQLNLTPAQRLEMEGIFAEQASAHRELRERHRGERQALAEQGKERVASVLSSEQQAQLEQVHAERKQRWSERGGERRGHKRGGPRG